MLKIAFSPRHLSPIHVAVAIALCLCITGSSFAQVVGKVHALLVYDTDDEKIGYEKTLDRQKMDNVLLQSFQQNGYRQRINWTVMTGSSATAANILKYYENLNSTSDDTLLFMFAGHGAMDDYRGQFLAFTYGGPLYRSDLRGAMVAQNHRLAVILTSACANNIDEVDSPAPAGSESLTVTTTEQNVEPTFVSTIDHHAASWNTLEDLLFEARGLIDVNSAREGQSSYTLTDIGACFFEGLAHEFGESATALDMDADGQVTWPEFLGHVDSYIDEELISSEEQFSTAYYLKSQPNRYWERFLLVKNAYHRTIQVRLQYYTQTDSGEWQWFTPDGFYTFQPGESSYLLHGPPEGFRIRAHAVRIWAQTPDNTWVWNSQRNSSFYLTDNRWQYASDSMETMTYTFR